MLSRIRITIRAKYRSSKNWPSGWKNDPETLPIIKTRVLSQMRMTLCECSQCKNWLSGWKDNPETLPIHQNSRSVR